MANLKLVCKIKEIPYDKIDEKLKDVKDKIAEITGLDFSRFRKSMMLSKGEFDAFLHAKADDRAKLLEQLTGKQIYGDISKQVFENHKLAKDSLLLMQAKAQGVSLLTEQELNDLYQTAIDNNLPCSMIVDAGKTEFNGVPTKTCIAIGPADPDKINEITGKLKLL